MTAIKRSAHMTKATEASRERWLHLHAEAADMCIFSDPHWSHMLNRRLELHSNMQRHTIQPSKGTYQHGPAPAVNNGVGAGLGMVSHQAKYPWWLPTSPSSLSSLYYQDIAHSVKYLHTDLCKIACMNLWHRTWSAHRSSVVRHNSGFICCGCVSPVSSVNGYGGGRVTQQAKPVWHIAMPNM